MMQHYNSIDPSFADHILRMAELEELNCHRIDRYKTTVSIILTIAGMVFALVILYIILLPKIIQKGNKPVTFYSS